MPSESSEPWGGVSDTALGAAEMRAEESLRSDRLIDDPFAAAFVAAAPPLSPDVPALADDAELAALVEAGVTGVAIRTRFFDDYVDAACAAGCDQVVLLAAGLDTRAFRLDWPDGVQLFELDLPELFAFKERRSARGLVTLVDGVGVRSGSQGCMGGRGTASYARELDDSAGALFTGVRR